MTALERAAWAEARKDKAWNSVLESEDGRIIIAEILSMCFVGVSTDKPEERELQQLGNRILHRSRLFDLNKGSFLFDYVSMLTRDKLSQPDSQPGGKKPASGLKWFGLLGRLLERKT